TPVAHRAHAAAGLTGQHRADLDLLEAGGLDAAHLVFVDLLVGLDQDVLRERIADLLHRDAAEDAVAETLDDLAAFDQRRDLDAVHRAAVELADDRVLRDVD